MWFPGSTSSAIDRLAGLCEQVKDRIAGVEPDSLRPSGAFDPVVRAQVKRDADALMEQFAGYFSPRHNPKRPARWRNVTRARSGNPRSESATA